MLSLIFSSRLLSIHPIRKSDLLAENRFLRFILSASPSMLFDIVDGDGMNSGEGLQPKNKLKHSSRARDVFWNDNMQYVAKILLLPLIQLFFRCFQWQQN